MSKLIEDNVGLVLDESKKTYFMGRLQDIFYENGFTGFGEFYEHILGDTSGQVLNKLVDSLSPHHTYLNRESEQLDYFQRTVLPMLAEEISYRGPKKLKIWSAGCSSGEEPYTLAMFVLEHFAEQLDSWEITVLATDVSESIITQAMSGIYSSQNIANLPDYFRPKYFSRLTEDNWMIKPRLKQIVRFEQHDLMEDYLPNGGKVDIIFCRNVMIFFDEPTRKSIIRRFYRHTMAGGYLFLGLSESIGEFDTGYHFVRPGIYRNEVSH
ncbi:protein-glutamate O-methyltransferase CheR [bacterium]|nr:protein-glutamate O-methyltransferase CheR [bacterium]